MPQLDGDERFDMGLVMVGGNDVVRLRLLEALRRDVERVPYRASQRTDQIVLIPAGRVGVAPFFFAPVSWVMTWRLRRLPAFVREEASRHSAVFVNLFRESADDTFVQRPELHAADCLHISDAWHRVRSAEQMSQATFPQRSSASLAMDH